MIYLLVLIVGLALGFLIASLYFDAQEKKHQQRWERQVQSLRQQLAQAQQALTQPPVSHVSPPQPPVQKQPSSPPQQTAPPPENHADTSPSPWETQEAYLKRLYDAFAAKGSVALQFQYSFPKQHSFVPGTGYLYNIRGDLLPDPTAFERTNTAMGYARDGLFFVYDVKYNGQTYTFQQILEEGFPGGFVRIQKVIRLARIRDGGSKGHYVLAQKGMLQITDL